MRHDGSDGRNDERLVLARDKKFLIGVVTVHNKIAQRNPRGDRTGEHCRLKNRLGR